MTAVPSDPAQPGAAENPVAGGCGGWLNRGQNKGESSPDDALALAGGATRRERQRAEILATVVEGRLVHAVGLAFEHLEEFPADDFLVATLSRAVAERGDPGLSAELAVFLERVGDDSARQTSTRPGRGVSARHHGATDGR